ncbi:hypothetical protein FPHOBKDP_00095 [Listeria phage LPJP1]|nr:hypothetical protein FPHOBKDP_00095 [Listeria phage LPJP1]
MVSRKIYFESGENMPDLVSNKNSNNNTDSDDDFYIVKPDSGVEGDTLMQEDDIDPSQVNNEGLYVNAMGETINAFGNTKIDTFDASYGKDNIRVLGMPLKYGPLDDANSRVYRNTFENDLPVIFITPGKPRLNKKLFGSMSGNTFNLFGIGEKIEDNVFPMINANKFSDGRFISFKQNYEEYYRYVQTILSYIYHSMGLEGVFDFSKYNNGDNYGIAFYANKSTSVSESSSNDYSQSSLASESNSKQAEIRENKTLA